MYTQRCADYGLAFPGLPWCVRESAQVTHTVTVHSAVKSIGLFMGNSCMWAKEKEILQGRWGAGVETQKNVRGEIGGWGRVPFNEPYAPSLSTIYDGA